MIKDIQKHIELVDRAIAWANEFGKDSFPFESSQVQDRSAIGCQVQTLIIYT